MAYASDQSFKIFLLALKRTTEESMKYIENGVIGYWDGFHFNVIKIKINWSDFSSPI